jgi:hypothetical protein
LVVVITVVTPFTVTALAIGSQDGLPSPFQYETASRGVMVPARVP